CTAPISAVRGTCVPPPRWGSRPTISMSPIRPGPMGGATDMVLNKPGVAVRSASLFQRARTSGWGAISSFWRALISVLWVPPVGMAESEPALGLAHRPAGHLVGQDGRQQMQRRVHAHARVAQRPLDAGFDLRANLRPVGSALGWEMHDLGLAGVGVDGAYDRR